MLGILQGILLAALASVLLLLARVSQPHVAFLGRVPGTNSYSDVSRHPENEALSGVVVFRPEASVIYVNAEFVLGVVLDKVRTTPAVHTVICDLSASPYLDLAGSRMLNDLVGELSGRGIAMRIVGARGSVRDLLRADQIDSKVGGLDRAQSLNDLLLKIAK